MNLENKLAIINANLDTAIMEVSSTTERDWLLNAQQEIKKVLWHIRKDKRK